MGCKNWSLSAKHCDSCTAAPASVFCRQDSAYLCPPCDAQIHLAAAARHARVSVCEVCERAPASVTCRADSAALCASCDADIHSANPLSRRHERVPVVPFYGAFNPASAPAEEVSEEEAEAASWLLPDPGSKPESFLFGELMEPYNNNLDLDLLPGKLQKSNLYPDGDQEEEKQPCSDGVVPVRADSEYGSGQFMGPVVDGFPAAAYDVDYPACKPLIMYNFTSQSISQSVSSSSLDVGVVPDQSAMADVSKAETEMPIRVFGADREARVLRYKEKRKNRKFEKTVRYASRKAYAETRPRVKGRFAKRSDTSSTYGVVPAF